MNLVWFRNDLRLDDNPALYDACLQGDPVIALYIDTPAQWKLHDESPAKLGFRREALKSLVVELASLGISLQIIECQHFEDIPKRIKDYCQSKQITGLFFNQEVPLNEQLRDEQVRKVLSAADIKCQVFNSDLLVPSPILNQQGQSYRVFTPWYRAWLSKIQQTDASPLPKPPAHFKPTKCDTHLIELSGSGLFRRDLWPADEKTALSRLATFARYKLRHYSDSRDYPAINGTSTLSPYLANGILSPRRCLMAIQQTAFEEGWDWRESSWLRELGWREFYRHLLLNFSHLNKGKPFKESPYKWPWQDNASALQAWQAGNTGYPIIDAAMKQLLQTSWMHNRLRMLTASFLCKLLLIDWREGERFFMQHLIDGDFASNNGGWQWSASTGCDASPWFRIFNPTTQSQKFDPEGDFIRRFLPELACLDNKQIHSPPAEVRKELGYSAPIIDYKMARERALAVLNN